MRLAIKKKIDKVKEVSEKLKQGKNFSILNLKGLPSNLLQKIRKDIRGKGEVLVLRKAVLGRVLKENLSLQSLVGYADHTVALIISEYLPAQLAEMLRASGVRVYAKAQQISPYNIDIEEGETTLPPGPALSELKAVGIQAQVKGGKIAIAKKATICKSGDKISLQAAKVLRMLAIKPFTLFGHLLSGIDSDRVSYSEELLTTPASYYVDGLRLAAVQACSLAVNAGYINGMSVSIFLKNALGQAQGLTLNAGIVNDESIRFILSGAMASGSALGGKIPVVPVPAEGEKPAQAV